MPQARYDRSQNCEQQSASGLKGVRTKADVISRIASMRDCHQSLKSSTDNINE
jgi:hypothetical protein